MTLFKQSIILLAILLFGTFSPKSTYAQTTVRQLVIVNGGVFSTTNPVNTTVAVFNPNTGIYKLIDTIRVASAQNVVADSGTAWVAAQDSIVSYNLSTHKRIRKAHYAGIKKLHIWKNRLLVGKFYGSGSFLHFYDKNTLLQITNIPQINNTVNDIVCIGDTAYISYNISKKAQSWVDSIGQLGMVRLSTATFLGNIVLGARGAGISKLFVYNKTNIIGIANGRRLLYNFNTTNQSFTVDSVGVRGGTALRNNILYANFKRGIGSYNIISRQILSDSVIVDTTNIVASVLDTATNSFYITQSNYTTLNRGGQYNMSGLKLRSFRVGNAPDAIALDYQNISSNNPKTVMQATQVWPNPFNNSFSVQLSESSNIVLYNTFGQICFQADLQPGTHQIQPTKQLSKGIYWLKTSSNSKAIRLIKL